MTEAESEAALERLRNQAGELFLTGHAEKHAQEKEERGVWQKDHEDRHGRQFDSHAEKHNAEQRAVEAALAGEERRLDAHRQAHDAAHQAHEGVHALVDKALQQQWDAHVMQHADQQRAVEAAQASMDKRLDAMNEFRNQLRDQAAKFVGVDQHEALEKLVTTSLDDVKKQIATEREERRAAEGMRRGSSASVAWIVAAISAMGGILAIIVVVANALSGSPVAP